MFSDYHMLKIALKNLPNRDIRPQAAQTSRASPTEPALWSALLGDTNIPAPGYITKQNAISLLCNTLHNFFKIYLVFSFNFFYWCKVLFNTLPWLLLLISQLFTYWNTLVTPQNWLDRIDFLFTHKPLFHSLQMAFFPLIRPK